MPPPGGSSRIVTVRSAIPEDQLGKAVQFDADLFQTLIDGLYGQLVIRHPPLVFSGNTRQILEPFSVILQAGGLPLLNTRRHHQGILEPLIDFFPFVHTSLPASHHTLNTYRAPTNVTHTGETTSACSPVGDNRPFFGFTRNTTTVFEFWLAANR